MADTALQQAFNLLVSAADPETAEAALKAGLAKLLSGSFNDGGPAISERAPVANGAPRKRGRPRKAKSGARRGRPPKPKPNGAPPADTGLTEDERTRLAFLRDHNASHPGIGPALMEAAIDGQALPADHLNKVRAVLAG